MPTQIRVALVVFWLASLFAVGTLARGQVTSPPANWQDPWQVEPLDAPLVLSGADVGFRVEGLLRGTPAGTIVIRYMGKWVEPEITPKMRLVR